MSIIDWTLHFKYYIDSHMAQWFPAYERLAIEKGYKLVLRTKSSCASVDATLWNELLKRENTNCLIWRDNILREIQKIRPEIVVLTNASCYKIINQNNEFLEGNDRLKALKAGEKSIIAQIQTTTDAKVILMKDAPWHEFDPFACLAAKKTNLNECRTVKDEALKMNSPWSVNEAEPARNTYFMDMNDHFCDDQFCNAVNDNFILVHDKHHVSRAYSAYLFKSLLLQMERLGVFKINNEKFLASLFSRYSIDLAK